MEHRSPSWKAGLSLLVALPLWACGSKDRAAPGFEEGPTSAFDAAVEGDDDDAGELPDGGDAGRADAMAAPDAHTSEMEEAAVAEDASADAVGQDEDGGPPTNGEPGLLSEVERVAVVDGKLSTLYLLDVASQSLLESFPLMGMGRVVAGNDGRFGYVLERDANVVQVVSSGLLAQPDPQASELAKAPTLLDFAVTGGEPSAVSAGGDRVELFFAGGAALTALSEPPDATPETAEHLDLGLPHDGLVLRLPERVLVTRKGSDSTPVILSVYDAALVSLVVDQLACTEPRGGAVSGDSAGVGCAEGVLRFRSELAVASVVPYPAGASGERVERLVPHPQGNVFATTLGSDLCVVRDAFVCVPQPGGGAVDYVFDASGKRLIVLGYDGALHLLSADTLAGDTQLSLLAPLSDMTPPQELPTLLSHRQHVLVSDPEGAKVHVVGAAGGLTAQGSIDLPGAFPTQQALFAYPL